MDDLVAFLINLPRSTKRRQVMEERLEELGLPYTLVPGIDGRAEWDRLSATVDTTLFSRLNGREVTPGDVGCYHAHLAVWQTFLNSGASVALVMEDDVVFHSNFTSALVEAVRVKDHWDYLKLNKIRAKQPVRQAFVGRFLLNAYIGPATGTGAYLIRRELAERLLPRMLPIRRPIDHELDRSHVHRFRHYGLEPFPSHVDDGGESTINEMNIAGVRKRRWYLRLPNYAMRISNLVGKVAYSARTGALFGGSTRL
jgi:glycosyl transferase, family 25